MKELDKLLHPYIYTLDTTDEKPVVKFFLLDIGTNALVFNHLSNRY
jgi:hypothetical protein